MKLLVHLWASSIKVASTHGASDGEPDGDGLGAIRRCSSMVVIDSGEAVGIGSIVGATVGEGLGTSDAWRVPDVIRIPSNTTPIGIQL